MSKRPNWLEKVLSEADQVRAMPRLRVQEAWLADSGPLHVLILIPLDPPEAEPAALGRGPRRPPERWAVATV